MSERTILNLITVLLAALLLLSSCSFSRGGDETETSSADPTTTDIPQENPLAALTEPAGDDLVLFSHLPFPVYDMSACADGKLLLLGTPSQETVSTPAALLDLMTGTVTEGTVRGEKAEDGDSYYPLLNPFILNGHPVLHDMENGTVTCYDEAMNITDTLTLDSVFVYANGLALGEDRLIISSYSEPTACIVSVSDTGTLTAEKQTVPLPGTSFILSSVADVPDAHTVIISTEDNSRGYYLYSLCDLDTDALTTLYFGDAVFYHSFCSGTVIGYNYSENTVCFYPAHSDVMHMVLLPEYAMPANRMHNNNRYFYDGISDPDTDTLTIERRSMETGHCTASVVLPGSDLYGLQNVQELGDTVLISYYDGDAYQVCLWKPAEEAQAAADSAYPFLSAVPESMHIREMIDDLEDRYDLHIYTEEDAVRYFNGYTYLPNTDSTQIIHALEAITDFLAVLPEGFADEVAGCFDDGINLYLAGRIIPDSSNRDSISDAAAFTNTDGSTESIVFDIDSYNFRSTVIHEFMHVIENAIYAKQQNSGNYGLEQFTRWGMLNPEGFVYSDVYTSEDGSTLGYNDTSILGSFYFDGSDADAIRFVDGYSTTYRTEDIARCFEYMFPMEGKEIPAYFKGIHMKEKASYLSVCIRDAFDCITEDVVPVWEAAADPAMDLQYFRNTYDPESLAVG